MAGSEGFSSGAFLHYWRANAVSGLGTYVTLFALQALLVLTLDGSATDVSIVAPRVKRGGLPAAPVLCHPI